MSVVNRSHSGAVVACSSRTGVGGVNAFHACAIGMRNDSVAFGGLAVRGGTTRLKRTMTLRARNSHLGFVGYHVLNGRSAVCANTGFAHLCFGSYCVSNAASFVFNPSATLFRSYVVRDGHGSCMATTSAPGRTGCKCIFGRYGLATRPKISGICLNHP